MKSQFLQRKKSVLSKQDKSSKGYWDTKIVKLCEKINKKENYYTTSSCSGRVVVMIDKDKKESNLFLKVWHDLISLKQLKDVLDKIAAHIDFKVSNLIKFKQEPCILHVACRTLEDAKKLLDKARLAGWKKSGILSLGDKIIVELSGTEKLEFPIIKDGKLIVIDDFLKVVVKKSNENLKESWRKIEKLKRLI